MAVSAPALSALLLGLAACFDPHAASGVPCDPATPRCPGDQACVLQRGAYVCSTGAADEPDARESDDDDGDGVLDVADNCPAIANPTQVNYDADRFGDACDPCPPYANDAPADGDDDGVSDDCDPDPAIAGDRIVMFDTFATLGGWRVTGTWSLGTGGASVDLATGAAASLTMPIAVSARTSVIASFTPTALRTFGGYAGLGATVDDVQCALVRMPATDEHIALIDTTAGSSLAAGDFAIDLDRPYTSTLTAAGIDRYRCRTANAEIAASTASPPATIGLRARGARGTYHWVLVLAAP